MTLSVRSLIVILTLLTGGLSVQMAAQANPEGDEGRPPRRPEGEPPGKGKGGPDGKRGPGGGKRGGSSAKVITDRSLKELWIPPLLEGKTLNLVMAASTKKFAETPTPTLGYNGSNFMGPTLVFNQGETVQINFKNNYTEPTTVHWHGLHLPATTDGGPHQLIPAGGTWNPSWVVKNNAGTYWYHPHPHELTQKQMALGATGLIIIRDPEEAKLALPRTYGVDDIPLVLTSRRFNTANNFTYAGDEDKYGDYPLANGVMDAQTKLPAQLVRLRLLNAEIERGYVLGFSDDRPFYLISTDGGLIDKPIALKRIRLMVGERAEILVDLGQDKPGSSLEMMAYNSGQTFGFPGGEPDSGGANGSLLNDKDFRILKINIAPATVQKLTAVPTALKTNRYPQAAEATEKRRLNVTDGRPFFKFDGKSFDMHSSNIVVQLGATETWTITNNNIFGHSFHIHDVQFKILSRSNGEVPDYENGWKDTAYLPKGQSVTFVAKFEDYASDSDPFMFHCHMANHEDGGMMGQFIVSKNPAAVKRETDGTIKFRTKVEHPLTAKLIASAARQADTLAPNFEWKNPAGGTFTAKALMADKPMILYFIEKECPCSRDAAVFIDQLQSAYGNKATIMGIINADATSAAAWTKTVGARFPVLADPELAIIDAYHAERSASTIVIAPGGTIIKSNPGYSAAVIKDLGQLAAQFTHLPEKSLSLGKAPEKLTSGCPLK